jgi:histidine triad (HIT) family protein
MENCLFCKIIKGEIPCYKVYEDKEALAFLDIKPHAKGHAVVVPKSHAVRIFDLNDKQRDSLFKGVETVMKKMEEKLHPDGFNVGWNQNMAAGQVIPHMHVHILPRYVNDGGGSMHSIVNKGVAAEEVWKLWKEKSL